MKEENKMDELFRDKLGGYSEEPPAYIWDGVREQMAKGIIKKRIAWYRWSAVAALLIMAFIAGWYLNETTDEMAPQVAQKEMVKSEVEKQADNKGSVSAPIVEEEVNDDEDQSTQFHAETRSKVKEDADNSNLQSIAEKNVNNIRNEGITPEMIKPVAASVMAKQSETSIKKEMKVEVAGLSAFEKERIRKNALVYTAVNKEKAGWRMGVNVSPGYSSYSAKHSETYAGNMTHDAADGNANLSGGISVKYRTAGRWSVESGIYYAQNGQQAESSPQLFGGVAKEYYASDPAERLYFNTPVTLENSRIAMNSTAGIIEFEKMPVGAEIAANLENSGLHTNSLITQGEFSQVFDLVEVPLYLRYLLIESKLDVELLGGINAGVVVGNNAFIENQFGVQKIGKTRDISFLNISGTLGLGFTYALGKQFSLALEPRLNYYMNSINNSREVNYKPYRIGMYTGVYYAF